MRMFSASLSPLEYYICIGALDLQEHLLTTSQLPTESGPHVKERVLLFSKMNDEQKARIYYDDIWE